MNSSCRDVMSFHLAKIADALKSATLVASAAILGVTVLSAGPAFANHGNGEGPHGNLAAGSSNNGNGPTKSNDNGRKSGTPDAGTPDSGTPDDSSVLKPSSASQPDEPVAEESPSAGTSDKPLVFITSVRSGSSLRAKMRRAQKELARLFALSDEDIVIEFPDGGYEDALMQAAALARRTERAYRRKRG